MKNRIVCIIPARGGSKRIPGKNYRNFHGKPIIQYVIDTAKKADIFDKIFISTDDEIITKIARLNGISYQPMRSKTNSNDYASTSDVIKEVLEYDSIRKINPAVVCCLYPTAVFTTTTVLRSALKMLVEEIDKIDCVIPVTRYSHPPQRGFLLNKVTNLITETVPKNILTRTQDLKTIYHDTGQFYMFQKKAIYQYESLLISKCKGIEIDESKTQDIDTLSDWKIAEFKYMLNNECSI